MTAWYDSRSRRKWQPSALNLRVTAENERCKANGGCVPGDRWVSRPYPMGQMELPCCKRCGVPMKNRGKAGMWNYWDPRERAA